LEKGFIRPNGGKKCDGRRNSKVEMIFCIRRTGHRGGSYSRTWERNEISGEGKKGWRKNILIW